jgi:4-hydroxybenzoate polyprenyltransferase
VVALLAAMVVLIYWLFEFYYLKNQPETFVEASLVFPRINRYVFAFALFAFLTSFLREIIKDMQDINGDSRYGCRTLPVVMGLNKIRYLLVFLIAITMVGLAWFQFVLFGTDQSAMALWLLSTQVLLTVSAIMTLKSREPASFGRLSTLMKIIMLSGLTSLIMLWF